MSSAVPHLEATADPASVSIGPPDAGGGFARLPELVYRIGIRARCGSAEKPASVSVSIADTQKTLPGEELSGDTDTVVDITIPASQLAPLALGNFCTGDGRAAGQLLLRDVLTAHLSLRCASDVGGESITYITRPLAIQLNCQTDDQGPPESPIAR